MILLKNHSLDKLRISYKMGNLLLAYNILFNTSIMYILYFEYSIRIRVSTSLCAVYFGIYTLQSNQELRIFVD